MEKTKPMIVPGKGRVLTIAEVEEMRRAVMAAAENPRREVCMMKYGCPFPPPFPRPAHVDPKPTIPPGKLRPCDNCGELCDPSTDGLCDECGGRNDAGPDDE